MNANNPEAVDAILIPIRTHRGRRPLLRAGYALEQLSPELRGVIEQRIEVDQIISDVRRNVVKAALEGRTLKLWQDELVQDRWYGEVVDQVLLEVSDIDR